MKRLIIIFLLIILLLLIQGLAIYYVSLRVDVVVGSFNYSQGNYLRRDDQIADQIESLGQESAGQDEEIEALIHIDEKRGDKYGN